jgi:ABC-2 type transport system permease protein
VPIHREGYRRYGGSREVRGRAWIVIAVTGIRMMVRRRAFLGFLLLAWAPFVVRAVQTYAASSLPQASFLAVSPLTFREFLDQQGLFIFPITIWAGAGLIAGDIRANALQIYLSKPLTRAEYVAGKLAVLGTFLLLVTWVPAMLLLALQAVFAGNLTFLRDNLFLIPAIALFSLIQALVASFTMLALSSLSRSSRFVAVTYAGLLFFTQALYGVVLRVTRRTAASWMSPSASLSQVGDVIFRLPARYDTPVVLSFAVLVGLVAVSIVVLRLRVRAIQVVT